MLAISSCSADAAATLLIPLQDEIEVLKADLAAERTARQQAEARVLGAETMIRSKGRS
jgi:hypothetical protein